MSTSLNSPFCSKCSSKKDSRPTPHALAKKVSFRNFHSIFKSFCFSFVAPFFFFPVSERPASPDPRLQVEDRDGTHGHLRRHLEDHRGRAHPQLHLGGGQGVLLQDEGRLPPVSSLPCLPRTASTHAHTAAVAGGIWRWPDYCAFWRCLCPVLLLFLLLQQSCFLQQIFVQVSFFVCSKIDDGTNYKFAMMFTLFKSDWLVVVRGAAGKGHACTRTKLVPRASHQHRYIHTFFFFGSTLGTMKKTKQQHQVSPMACLLQSVFHDLAAIDPGLIWRSLLWAPVLWIVQQWKCFFGRRRNISQTFVRT